MPRRWSVDGKVCHVYNRAAAKLPLFKSAADYRGFLKILESATLDARPTIRLYGYCLMPNHWHLIICPETTSAMSQFMRHLTRRHAVCFLADHPERSGAVYQGRFKCVPVQDGEHLRTLLLYVDRNPLKAGFVRAAEAWPWSSVVHHAGLADDPLLDPLPPKTCDDWLAQVNRRGPIDDLTKAALKRNLPVGDPQWIESLSRDWNVLRRPRGRPGKINREELSVENAVGAGFDRAD